MHETLPALVARALTDNPRPLEYYLREQSHLPGPRANLGLVGEVSDELASYALRCPQDVWEVLHYLVRDAPQVETNSPGEFVVLCGTVALGACAATNEGWRDVAFERLAQLARNSAWRVREGAAMGFQRLLAIAPEATVVYLLVLAREGDCLQQRASIAAVAEPFLLQTIEMKEAALAIQRRIVLRFRDIPQDERRRDDVRILRQALAYTLSVVAAAHPEQGFALLRECASWGDADITWVIRENLKKKRLAKFTEQTAHLSKLLA